jgi:aminopeptidase N
MRFGILLYRYHIMKTIDSVYKKAKHGYERYPLQTLQVPNPSEFMLNELVYEKSELIMHMIESMIDKQYFERIIRDLYHQSSPFVTTKSFQKIFKQVCGMKLKDFSMNWIAGASCLTLSVSCVYNKKNNSLDLKLQQDSAMKDHFAFRKYLQEGVDLGDLLSRPFVRKDKIYMSD